MNDDIKKKTALLYIREILQSSDQNNKLTRRDICKKLEVEYDMVLDRRAVSRNLDVLKASGMDIREDARSSGVYLGDREFTDGELQLIIDGLRFSSYIPQRYVDDMVRKLSAFGTSDLRKLLFYEGSDIYHERNMDIFDIIETINEAMRDRKKVSFVYTEYDLQKRDGELFGKAPVFENGVVINPYAKVMRNGYYYLLGSYDGDDNIVAFRVDKIYDLKITDDDAAVVTDRRELQTKVREYLFAHPYLHTGKTTQVYMKISIRLLDKAIDTFGKKISICMHDEYNYRIGMNVGETDIVDWALQNAGYAEILTPDRVREKVKKRISGMAQDYGMNVHDDASRSHCQSERPQRYPYNLLSAIFEDRKQFSDDDKAIGDTLDDILNGLKNEQRAVIQQIYKNGLSREAAAAALGMTVQELAVCEATTISKLRYSKYSIRLAKFLIK